MSLLCTILTASLSHCEVLHLRSVWILIFVALATTIEPPPPPVRRRRQQGWQPGCYIICISSFQLFSPFYYILLILLSNVKDRCFVKYELRRRHRRRTLIVNERNFLLLSLFKKKKLTAPPALLTLCNIFVRNTTEGCFKINTCTT